MFWKLRSTVDNLSASFQLLSDLHLEINQQYSSYEIPVCAEYLVLAGDVGRLVDYDNYRGFLKKQTDRFRLVFLILGNHEFYNDTFTAALQKARQLEQESCLNGRLILLHQGHYDIPGTQVTVLGCTLWSKVPNTARDIVSLKIQDFKNIQDWTVDDHNESHDADLSWLLGELEFIRRKNKTQNKRQSILVVTHHAPSLQKTSSPQSPSRAASKLGFLGTHTTPLNSKGREYASWRINGDTCFPGIVQRTRGMNSILRELYLYSLGDQG